MPQFFCNIRNPPYPTGGRFMGHLGIHSAKGLPRLKDISAEENSIGEMME